MKSLLEVTAYPGLDYSRAAQIGRRLVALGLGVKATHGIVATAIPQIIRGQRRRADKNQHREHGQLSFQRSRELIGAAELTRAVHVAPALGGLISNSI